MSSPYHPDRHRHAVVLMDIDGVICTAERFSTRYARQHGVSPQILTDFFDHRFPSCLTGVSDLVEELETVKESWRWDGSSRELLDHWFEDDVVIDPQVLDTLARIHAHHIPIYCASNQERYRAVHLMDSTPLAKYVTRFFFSSDLGVTKPHPDFFRSILSALHIEEASHVVFWDDDGEHVASAQSLGITSFHYTDYATFRSQVAAHLGV